MRRPRELSLRARLLLFSVVALTAGLAAGGVLLVAVLNFALLRAVNSEARDTAKSVAGLIDVKELGDPIPVNAPMQVQVVNSKNQVLNASAGTDRYNSVLRPNELERAQDGSVYTVPGNRIAADGELRVAVWVTGPPTQPQYVLVARSTGDLAQGVRILAITLLIAFPMLIALLGVVLWRVLGAALDPVVALTAGAEEITGGTRAGRLPVPESRDEIHRLAVTLNGMLHRLDSARAKQRAFVADAAHELRSPLTNMRTEIEVAQHLSDSTDWPQLTADLLTDVDRLSRLVDDLLLLARSDDGAARAPARRFEPVDLGQFLSDLAARYPDVGYQAPPSGSPIVVQADPDGLARMIGNLLDNAVRHKTSQVRLTAAQDGSYARITVTDDGPGIPPVDRERVFDRFTRLDDGRARDAGGSGLGLAIVRELVRRHRGTVTLSDAAPGLRVDVRLPE
jgi:signal transduction histidine kinase